MGSAIEAYTSGDWTVKAGREEEFVARWTEFIDAALTNAAGAGRFVLLRDNHNPRHFVSTGSWADQASIDRWRTSPGFGELFGRVRELCEHDSNSNYSVAAAPTVART